MNGCMVAIGCTIPNAALEREGEQIAGVADVPGRDIMQWKQWLRIRSRDETALWQMVALILAGGLVVGAALDSAMPSARPRDLGDGISRHGPRHPSRGGPGAARGSPGTRSRAAARGGWGEVWWGVWRELPRGWADLGRPGWHSPPVCVGSSFCGRRARWTDGVTGGLCRIARRAGTGSGEHRGHVVLDRVAGVWLGIAGERPAGGGLRYNILGIGLREEAAKVLCGAVLLPWLVRRRDELGALLAFACVGLGLRWRKTLATSHRLRGRKRWVGC